MADPTDPTTPDPSASQASAQGIDGVTTSLDHMAASTKNASVVLGDFNNIGAAAKSVFGQFESQLASVGTSLGNLKNLTATQTTQVGLLSSALLGARVSFEGFAGVDYSNMSTFTSQLDELTTILNKDSIAYGMASGAASKLAQSLANITGNGKEVTQMLNAGADVFVSYAKKVLIGADNALKLQQSMVALSAETGGLGDLYAAAGPNLERMNFLLQQQSSIMAEAGKATGLSASQVEQYWAELARIPGAMQSVVNVSEAGGETTSMLTAAIEVARGSGRSYRDIMVDLNKAYKDYGLVGEPALRFSARMSDVATKLKAPLEDVRAALSGSADQFKMFVNAGEDAARSTEEIATVMNTYAGALQQVGVSASNAIGVVSQMLGGIKDLRIEQKAFLSQQTGGPGGLMGGFQIEKMMREGKMGEVMEKVMQSMQRQFGGGKIVNFEEASQSQASATQYERQIRMLQQGPLGGMVKDRESAERLLDSMRKRSEGQITTNQLAGSTTVVQDQMAKGVDLQKGSYTELTKIRAQLEAIRYSGNVSNLNFTQSAVAARVGASGPGFHETHAQREQRQNLNVFAHGAQTRGGTFTEQYNLDMQNGMAQNYMGTRMAADVKGVFKTLTQDLPRASASAIDALKQAVNAGNPDEIRNEEQRLRADIEARKSALKNAQKNMSQAEYQKQMRGIQSQENSLNNAMNVISTNNLLDDGTTRNVPRQTPTAGRQVGNAARGVANTPPLTTTTATGGAPAMNPKDLNIHVTGTMEVRMPDGSIQHITPQMRAVNPAAGH